MLYWNTDDTNETTITSTSATTTASATVTQQTRTQWEQEQVTLELRAFEQATEAHNARLDFKAQVAHRNPKTSVAMMGNSGACCHAQHPGPYMRPSRRKPLVRLSKAPIVSYRADR